MCCSHGTRVALRVGREKNTTREAQKKHYAWGESCAIRTEHVWHYAWGAKKHYAWGVQGCSCRTLVNPGTKEKRNTCVF